MKIEECVKDLESQIRIDKDFLWNHPEKGNEECGEVFYFYFYFR